MHYWYKGKGFYLVVERELHTLGDKKYCNIQKHNIYMIRLEYANGGYVEDTLFTKPADKLATVQTHFYTEDDGDIESPFSTVTFFSSISSQIYYVFKEALEDILRAGQ